MEVFITTLTSSNERIKNVLELRQHLIKINIKVNLVNAVNGYLLDDRSFENLNKKNIISKTELQKGQIGCALSNYFIWEYISIKNINHAVLIEDDVFLNKNFGKNLMNVISELTSDYDLCYIFHHPWMQKELYKSENHIKEKKYIQRSIPMYGTVGYIISPQGAKKLIKNVKPIFTTIDDHIIRNFKNMNVYASKIQLCDTFGEMGIMHGRDNSEPEGSKNIGDRKLLTSTVKPRNMDFMKEIDNKKIPFDTDGIKMLQPKIFLGKIKFMTIDLADCRVSQFKAC